MAGVVVLGTCYLCGQPVVKGSNPITRLRRGVRERAHQICHILDFNIKHPIGPQPPQQPSTPGSSSNLM